jgi:hypothetical protein
MRGRRLAEQGALRLGRAWDAVSELISTKNAFRAKLASIDVRDKARIVRESVPHPR